jgi:hypothetical protein
MKRPLFHLFLSAVLGLAFQSFAAPTDQWIWRNPTPFRPQLQSVTHGGGLWLVFGNVAVITTSPDGITWDLASLGTNAVFINGAYGNGRFVAGTTRGSLFSFDGHKWIYPLSGGNLNDMSFGNGWFVGVDGAGSAWRTTTGTNWTSVLVSAVQLNHISFANGLFFVPSTPPFPQLFISTNGANWGGPFTLGTNGIQKIAFGNGVYVSVNNVIVSGTVWSELRTSANGTNWPLPNLFLTNTVITDTLFANNRFLAIDEAGGILVSTNGANWTEQAVPELFGCTKLDWDGNLYVAAGPGGKIATSPDGISWTSRVVGPQNSLVGVIHTNNLFVAVGGNLYDILSQSTVATSTDAHVWTEHNPGTTNSLAAIAYGNGRYVAVGTNGTIISSQDASNWTPISSPTTNALYSIACGAGQFVAVGGAANRATILNSSDGLNWAFQLDAAANFNTLYSITFAQGQFVAVGQTNGSKVPTILTSPDGLAWTSRSVTASNHLRTIGFGNGVFFAGGDNGLILSSPDVITWTNVSATVLSWRAAAYGNGQYVLVSTSPPSQATSTNGINWTFNNTLRNSTLQPIYGIVCGDNAFFVVGYGGEVLESGPFNPPPPEIALTLKSGPQPFLSFTGPESHGYELQGSDILPPVWQTLVTITNYSSTTTLPVSTSTNTNSRFYRARFVN